MGAVIQTAPFHFKDSIMSVFRDEPIRETVGCEDDNCPCIVCKLARSETVHANSDKCIEAGDHFKRICTDGYCTMCGAYYGGAEEDKGDEEDEDEDEDEEEEEEEGVVEEVGVCPCFSCRRERGEGTHDSKEDCVAADDHGATDDGAGSCCMCGEALAEVDDAEEETSEEAEEENEDMRDQECNCYDCVQERESATFDRPPVNPREALITTDFKKALSRQLTIDVAARREILVHTERFKESLGGLQTLSNKLTSPQLELLTEIYTAATNSCVGLGAGPRETVLTIGATTNIETTTSSVVRRLVALLQRRLSGTLPIAREELCLSRESQLHTLEDLAVNRYSRFSPNSFINTYVRLAVDVDPPDGITKPYAFCWVEATGLIEDDSADELFGSVVSAAGRSKLNVGDTLSFSRGEVVDVFVSGRMAYDGLDPVLMPSNYDYMTALNAVRAFASDQILALNAAGAKAVWECLSDQEKLSVKDYAERIGRIVARRESKEAAEVSAVA